MNHGTWSIITESLHNSFAQHQMRLNKIERNMIDISIGNKSELANDMIEYNTHNSVACIRPWIYWFYLLYLPKIRIFNYGIFAELDYKIFNWWDFFPYSYGDLSLYVCYLMLTCSWNFAYMFALCKLWL